MQAWWGAIHAQQHLQTRSRHGNKGARRGIEYGVGDQQLLPTKIHPTIKPVLTNTGRATKPSAAPIRAIAACRLQPRLGQDLKKISNPTSERKLPIIYLSYFGSEPPSYYGNRYQYVPGSWPLEWPPPPDKVPAALPRKILAISATNLRDVSTPEAPLFAWLRAPGRLKKSATRFLFMT